MEERQSGGELVDQPPDTILLPLLHWTRRQPILQSPLVAELHHDTELAQGVPEVVQVSNYVLMGQFVENQRLLVGQQVVRDILTFHPLYSNLISFLGVTFLQLHFTEIHAAKCSIPEGSNFLELTFAGFSGQHNAAITHDMMLRGAAMGVVGNLDRPGLDRDKERVTECSGTEQS